MIDPPTIGSGQLGRKDEVEQFADFAIQLLLEEAYLVGWQRREFLAAIIESANARLSAIAVGHEPSYDAPPTIGLKPSGRSQATQAQKHAGTHVIRCELKVPHGKSCLSHH